MILVVDDEHTMQSLLAQALKLVGYDARVANDGFDALLRVREQAPLMVISDLQMSGMTGYELLSVLRRRFPEIPVIALSGSHQLTTVPACVICDAFFEKANHSPSELLAKVDELLRAKHRAALPKDIQIPAWLPRGRDGYYIVTCTHCLRPFPIRSETEVENAQEHTPCLYCQTALTYFVEGIREVA